MVISDGLICPESGRITMRILMGGGMKLKSILYTRSGIYELPAGRLNTAQ